MNKSHFHINVAFREEFKRQQFVKTFHFSSINKIKSSSNIFILYESILNSWRLNSYYHKNKFLPQNIYFDTIPHYFCYINSNWNKGEPSRYGQWVTQPQYFFGTFQYCDTANMAKVKSHLYKCHICRQFRI